MLDDCIDIKNNNLLFNVKVNLINETYCYNNFFNFNKNDIKHYHKIVNNIIIPLTSYYNDIHNVDITQIIKSIVNGFAYRTINDYYEIYNKSRYNTIIEPIIKLSENECEKILLLYYNQNIKYISQDKFLQRQIKIKTMYL